MLWSGYWYGEQTVDIPKYSEYKLLVFIVNGSLTLHSVCMRAVETHASGVGFPNDTASIHVCIMGREGSVFSIKDIGFVQNGSFGGAFQSRKENYASSYRITHVYGVK